MDHKSEQKLWDRLIDLAGTGDTVGLIDLIETLSLGEAMRANFHFNTVE